MEDLCAFCNEDSLPTLGQAAVAHAQFEIIHPFVDGNGRAGRALMHLVLRRRGLGLRVLTADLPCTGDPVAGLCQWFDCDPLHRRARLSLSVRGGSTVGSLSSPRHVGERWSTPANSRSGCARCNRLGESASEPPVAIPQSACSLVMLPAAPVLTVSTAAELIGRSFQATSQGIDRLVDAGVLSQVNVGRRNRAFEAPELIEAFNSLERRGSRVHRKTRASHDGEAGASL